MWKSDSSRKTMSMKSIDSAPRSLMSDEWRWTRVDRNVERARDDLFHTRLEIDRRRVHAGRSMPIASVTASPALPMALERNAPAARSRRPVRVPRRWVPPRRADGRGDARMRRRVGTGPSAESIACRAALVNAGTVRRSDRAHRDLVARPVGGRHRILDRSRQRVVVRAAGCARSSRRAVRREWSRRARRPRSRSSSRNSGGPLGGHEAVAVFARLEEAGLLAGRVRQRLDRAIRAAGEHGVGFARTGSTPRLRRSPDDPRPSRS